MKTIGKTLKELRDLSGMTLRQIEESTGISNAYLSQLENDKIKHPSINFLYKLATIYNVPLDMLLLAIGIIREDQQNHAAHFQPTVISTQNLTPEEEAALIAFLKYLRHPKN